MKYLEALLGFLAGLLMNKVLGEKFVDKRTIEEYLNG